MAEKPVNPCLGILSRSRVFQAAPCADLEGLALRCVVERYRRGEQIVQRGVPGDALVVVGRGRAKATLPAPGADAELVVSLLWPGDLFGEAELFDRQVRTATAIAVTEVEVAFVPRIEFLALLERRPAVAVRLAEALCDKLRIAREMTISLRFLDIPSRLYRQLLYLGQYDSRPEAGGVHIQHGLSQQELADSIGASREALNKIISDWKRAGVLEWGRGFVVLPDPGALQRRLPHALRSHAAPDDWLPAFEIRARA